MGPCLNHLKKLFLAESRVKPSHTIAAFVALGLAVPLLAAWVLAVEPSLLVVRHLERSRWPGTAVKVAFFSDLHAGAPHVNREYIADLVARVNAEAPDVVLIGGDLTINDVPGGKPMPIADTAALLAPLKAPLGVYAVLGNHDWWNGADAIKAELRGVGIEVLENDAKLLERPDATKIWLVGLGDDYTRHADVAKAFAATNGDWPKLVFMHDPGALLNIRERFHIAFAGHLHGGQVYIPGLGALVAPGRAPKSWAKGWVDFDGGSLYVSAGIGTSILPIRFNAPPEFVVLSLMP
jgi:predicted MPP superfamily phosphohydrolase